MSTGPTSPPAAGTEQLPLARAINLGLRHALERDPKVLLMGEDIGALGGVFRVTDGLLKDFGASRVVDTPLAESGIVGTAIGMAMAGYRPVVEIQFDGFVFPAFDQITTQLAKMSYRSRGAVQVPVVIRIPYGGGIGAVEHHSESPEALFAHTPGLRVISPATAGDAYAMIQDAIACPDPVIFLEPKARYWEKGPVRVRPPGRTGPGGQDVGTEQSGPGAHSAQDEQPPSVFDPGAIQNATVVREGTDITLAGYGPTMRTIVAAAQAAQEEGTSAEVIDLRSVSPLDIDTVATSVRKTGRLVVVHEAPTYFGAGAELAASISAECFYHLQAPVLRVGGFHTPYPVANLEEDYLPDLDRIMHAIDDSLSH
ncbi:alpha-ketoacid dehydrogenase subunit beta [Pseudactinotalea sp. Z1739]|uniref:alpha-ketoacid dehydrogenase subunit beta n=1 Tax=Pseudactinotalea sp. Z1739 TaxID=3413028 RepID=UPI003C7D08CD